MIRNPPGSKLGEASEAAVVALAMNGDDAAFGELVRRRQDAIRNLFRRMTREPALADDLAQQAFLLAWKSIRTLKSPAAFGGLPPDARLCVVLAYSEGMSHAEISEATAIPLGTVKSHIARGAARLRELLQAYGDRHVQ